MSAAAFDLQTISDTEAAAKLGFPLRSVRAQIDSHGLCLRSGRRRRLTPAQFIALQRVMTPCPLKSIRAHPASTTSVVRSRGDVSTRALALASVRKPKRSARRLRPTYSDGPSTVTKP